MKVTPCVTITNCQLARNWACVQYVSVCPSFCVPICKKPEYPIKMFKEVLSLVSLMGTWRHKYRFDTYTDRQYIWTWYFIMDSRSGVSSSPLWPCSVNRFLPAALSAWWQMSWHSARTSQWHPNRWLQRRERPILLSVSLSLSLSVFFHLFEKNNLNFKD